MDEIGGQPGRHVHKVPARSHKNSSSATGPVLVWNQGLKSSLLEICLLQVPALGAQDDAAPAERFAFVWRMGERLPKRVTFEIRMEDVNET